MNKPLTYSLAIMATVQAALLATLIIAAPANAGHHEAMDHGKKAVMKEMENNDIVDVAVAAGSFNTLAAALTAAGLVDTLKGDGPFTVFAPTDAAFAKLPEGTVQSLLLPENKDKLIAILTYHVVAGEVDSAAVMKLNKAKTVNGKDVQISASSAGVKINGATVVKADIGASNGIIHVIDTVILPPAS